MEHLVLLTGLLPFINPCRYLLIRRFPGTSLICALRGGFGGGGGRF